MSKAVDDTPRLKDMLTGEAKRLDPVTPFNNSKRKYDEGYDALFKKDDHPPEHESELEALLPCPFCGGEAKLKHTYDGGDYYGVAHSCASIVGHTHMHKTPEGAIERWNRREG